MLSILKNGVDFIKSLLIQNADFFNQMSRAGIVDQELRLLAFFNQRNTKISFIDRIPVYFAQLIAVNRNQYSNYRHFGQRKPSVPRVDPPSI